MLVVADGFVGDAVVPGDWAKLPVVAASNNAAVNAAGRNDFIEIIAILL
jgi:hypothetical protein